MNAENKTQDNISEENSEENVKQKKEGDKDPKRKWYAIHTYSGYENAVARNLRQRIDSLGVENKIFNVLVPTEKKIKIKGGKRAEVEEKIYQGYVLVEMIYDSESWYIVRNTPRVTGFVGSGVVPVPLNEKEVETLFGQISKDTVKHKIDLTVDEAVRIIDGPLKSLKERLER